MHRRESADPERGLPFSAATRLRRGFDSNVPGEPAQLALVHPLDFQVLEQLPVRHPEPPPFRDADLVRLDLGGRIGVIETFREQLLPFPELADVDELVHHVEIDVPPVSRSQVVRRDHEVAVLVADAHVPPFRGEELDLERAEDGLRPRSENPADRVHVLEALARTSIRSRGSRWTSSLSGPTARRSGRSTKAVSR